MYSWGGNWRGQLGRITKIHHSGQGPHSKQRMLINALKANWSVQRCVGKIALKARGKTKMRDCYPKPVVLEQVQFNTKNTGSTMGRGGHKMTTDRLRERRHAVVMDLNKLELEREMEVKRAAKAKEIEHHRRKTIVGICAHGHASACLLEDGTVYTWGRVAVPKHLVVNTKEPLQRDHSHDGALADRPLPIKNELLKLPGERHHAVEVCVTEAAVVVIYDALHVKNIEAMVLKEEKEIATRKANREAWKKRVEMQQASRRK